jgi:Na+-transporting NADH:ubiquinone oxidoreductase subunit C
VGEAPDGERPVPSSRNVFRSFIDLPRDSTAKTLVVSFLICLVCSLVLAVSTVILRPIRVANEKSAQSALLAEMLADQTEGAEVESVEEWVVELATGQQASGIDPATFDALQSASGSSTGRPIPPERDIARIQRQALHAPVQIVRRGGKLHAVVLPVYGRGYASLIRGSVVVAADANTILGLAIHEHGETPGIGSEIDRTDWQNRWIGKQIRDEQGALRLQVTMNEPELGPEDAAFQVDGISGATRSSLGVGSMVRFWMSEDGFGPFLERVRAGELQ